ncbi:MAG: M15 family metallopeptidase [Deltaproteobacteria bacterium]|nr:M15 family metallopeptidase [Deltaproteobacteria bacterium]
MGKRLFALTALCILTASLAAAATITESMRNLAQSKDFIEIQPGGQIAIDLRYASTNNFTKTNLYGEFNKAYLHKDAALKLLKASENLGASHPGHKLLILDALRPRSVQRALYAHVKGSAMQPYVADPDKGSVHNYGLAVDLTVIGPDSREIDMGTGFDDFSPLSEPQKEDGFLKNGRLSAAQIANRKILRNAMTKAGFIQQPLEWWHYDAMLKKDIKSSYEIFE